MTDSLEYRCAMCGEVFRKAWTDAEAAAEAAANSIHIQDAEMVCDDCYRTTPWGAGMDGFQAKWWEMMLAKLFGTRVVNTDEPGPMKDGGCTVVGYRWRGRLYVTEVHNF